MLRKASELIFREEVARRLEEAKEWCRGAEIEAEHYGFYLGKTGNSAVWGSDARKAKRDLAAAKKNLAFWRLVAKELKGSK